MAINHPWELTERNRVLPFIQEAFDMGSLFDITDECQLILSIRPRDATTECSGGEVFDIDGEDGEKARPIQNQQQTHHSR